MSGTLLGLLILAILFIMVGVIFAATMLINLKKSAKERAKTNKKERDYVKENRLIAEIQNKFTCTKCGHKENKIKSIATPSKGLASFMNLESHKLFQVYCTHCGYSHMFNKTLLMNEQQITGINKHIGYSASVSLLQDFEGDLRKKFKKEFDEADIKHQHFKCIHCGTTEKSIDLLCATGKGISKLIDYHENDFSAATCKTCGYMEFYRS